jgi:hypothetical protein
MTVSEEKILMELRALDASRWFEVLDFIGYLKQRGVAQTTPPPQEAGRKTMIATDLLQSDLIGLWADRDDIGDSLEFARQLRRAAETRTRA